GGGGPGPGGRGGEGGVPAGAGGGGGEPLVQPRPAARRQRLDGGGADQGVRRGDPVPGLGDHPGEYRRIESPRRVVEVIKDRQCLAYGDPSGGRDDGQRLRGIVAQRAGEPVGQRPRQGRDGAV